MKKLSSLLLIVLLSFTAQSKDLSRKSEEIYNLISQSKIPEQIKDLYFKVSILESGWHSDKRALKLNNFSGFRTKTKKGYKLIRFQSIENWIEYSEKFFQRKNIEQVSEFLSFIKKGKYCARYRAASYIRTLNYINFNYERIYQTGAVQQYIVCARRNAGCSNYAH